jgi:hypothetical protein
VSPEELFYTFPEPVPSVCWRLRDLVLEVAPDAVEAVRPRWRHVGYGVESAETPFCAVAPQKDGARIVFDNGVDLPDPDRRLQGSGEKVRWLAWRRPEEVDDELVRVFVRAAITAGSGRATARPR